jgi:hypothetical protein
MKITERHSLENIRTALAAVRATIEREFALLLEQEPRVFRLALNEAEALAWETEFPQLIYPALAVEKVNAVAKWYARQRSVRRSEPTLAFAA